MQNIKVLILSLLIGVTLAASITYAAWSTNTWHDPNSWISNGATISAQKIAENFAYLKARVGSTPTCTPVTTLVSVCSYGASSSDCPSSHPVLLSAYNQGSSCGGGGGSKNYYSLTCLGVVCQ